MSDNSGPKKLWGGRFRGGTDPVMEKFNNSISYDRRMWEVDIEGSKQYSRAMVGKTLTEDEVVQLHEGLDRVAEEWRTGVFEVKDGDEDIHTANERRLSELVGSVGGKLHTGRSRNDQVATDIRLWLRNECTKLEESLKEMLLTLAQQAETHLDLLMPGFTHLQPAQPILFSHWLMSHAAALRRDLERLGDVKRHLNVMPLGSGALAGQAFGLDRNALATALGFSGPTSNSLDAVCDRDFIAEFLFWASVLTTHFSQMSEDLIIYNLMGFVTIADAYSTGSSLMPQKKNPDALELLRGRAGTIQGRLTGFLVTLKGLPRSYNKDLQEDKIALFDVADSVTDCLEIATGVVATLQPRAEGLLAKLCPEMLATDLAEYLVRKGVPFRETHHISGAAVRMAEDSGVPLNQLTADQLRSLHPLFEDDVSEVWSYQNSVDKKDVVGGTARSSVVAQIAALRSSTTSPFSSVVVE